MDRPSSSEDNLLFLWSPPRSFSTAFLRMMIERGDHLVIHEPFSSIVVQGYVTIEGNKISDQYELLKTLENLSVDGRVFVKETTEYRYDIVDHPRFPLAGCHTFIIRDPKSVISSHYAMNPDATCAEIGFEHQFEILRTVYEKTGVRPVVLEAEELASNPAAAVRDYCERVGIDFVKSALSWEPGDRKEWSRTRKWHATAAQSNGFEYIPRIYEDSVENNATLASYYEYQRPFYERMRPFLVK
ncbi:sulfotransferase family protein [Streptomyces sp. NBC_01619]|uniref:sulfotransferase-like domain-containing protein n=1 Tax=Streptomyces sp. NBC_01619 TaxID=2975901 RepID=UPI00224FA0DA|nr:sulfotransferase family protein [Streptomyces sp. NBC_01619]MCX4515780.1 sulfotransferase family protein [Streptomyces sp. NBC_01619]